MAFIPTATAALYLNDDGELWTLNVKNGDTALLSDEAEDVTAVRFTDAKTAYAQIDGEIALLTLGKGEWKAETVCKDAADGMIVSRGGAILALDDGTLTLIDGKKTTEVTDELEGVSWSVSEDGKSVVLLDDGDILYVAKPGAKAEKLAKDAGTATPVIFDGSIYYLNDDGDFCKMSTKGKVEVVAEDIVSFGFRYISK